MELQGSTRISLSADRLCVHVGEKQLLHEVSAVASSGSLLAVMGPSGSGKTTFLNTVSGRMKITTGSLFINNKPISTKMRKSFGYVTQTDVFFPMLTLRQTVEFAARVKLPPTMSDSDRRRRITSVIESLQLEKCLDTVIGNFMRPGLSGGEKKRANIACELLPNPDVLLLDEPTSGLDASLALKLIEQLRQWSQMEQKVVMMSIHQPSSPIFHAFDHLLLLTDGHTSYFGQTELMADYFDSIGVPFEPLWNPADYMLEVVKAASDSKQLIIDKGSAFSELSNIMQTLSKRPKEEKKVEGEEEKEKEGTDSESQSVSEQQRTTEVNGAGGHVNGAFDEVNGDTAGENSAAQKQQKVAQSEDVVVEFSDDKIERVSWFRQLGALTIRGFHISRSRFLSPEPIVRTLFIGILSMILWFQITKTEEHIRDVLGCIFFLSINLSFAPLFEAIMAFHEDIHVVTHERRAGMYQIGAYYAAKLLTEMPLTIAVPFVSLTIVFWSAGLGGFLQYLAFIMAILFNSLACQGIGTFIGLLTNIPKANITIAFIFMLTSLLLGGFFATTVPVYLVWLKYLSFIRYCFHFCLLIVFENSPNYLCSQTSASSYPICANATIRNALNQSELPASEILQYYPDTLLPVWANFGIILVFLVVFRSAAYLWLRFMKKM